MLEYPVRGRTKSHSCLFQGEYVLDDLFVLASLISSYQEFFPFHVLTFQMPIHVYEGHEGLISRPQPYPVRLVLLLFLVSRSPCAV